MQRQLEQYGTPAAMPPAERRSYEQKAEQILPAGGGSDMADDLGTLPLLMARAARRLRHSGAEPRTTSRTSTHSLFGAQTGRGPRPRPARQVSRDCEEARDYYRDAEYNPWSAAPQCLPIRQSLRARPRLCTVEPSRRVAGSRSSGRWRRAMTSWTVARANRRTGSGQVQWQPPGSAGRPSKPVSHLPTLATGDGGRRRPPGERRRRLSQVSAGWQRLPAKPPLVCSAPPGDPPSEGRPCRLRHGVGTRQAWWRRRSSGRLHGTRPTWRKEGRLTTPVDYRRLWLRAS